VMNAYPTTSPLVQNSSDNKIINVLKNLWPNAIRII
jgi:vomeronasal1 receptor